ncbi:MAG: C1 family peptidase [Bacteroidales bacterium]|nr:C1 family peptidase [Bacteroidales bacterium]MDY2930824.1 C1 family peptidase [Muribaculaceae bacterium]
MKKIVLSLGLVLGSMLSVSASSKAEPVNPDSTGFKFTDEIVIKTTPVKDQNKTGTCWSFSTVSFFENEILKATGKEVDLSEMFIVHHCYLDKAIKYVRMDGTINFAEGGNTHDVPYVFKNYGALPEEVYSGLNYGEDKHNHKELITVMRNYMDGVKRIPNKKLSTAWFKGLEGILDAYLGVMPEKFTFEGKEYTPRSYWDSFGINVDNYLKFSSFTHHPFYEKFALEVADNWLWGMCYNVKMNELKEITDYALSKGYSVAWAADVSEGGFQWYNGFAILPKERTQADMEGTELARWVKLSDKDREAEKFEFKGPVPEIEVTQEMRQEMFDSHETSDDHGMVIVGTAHDQEGNRYYKVKNSWDTNQVYDGYFYVSEAYFLAKTIDIMVNKDAVPKSVISKLK